MTPAVGKKYRSLCASQFARKAEFECIYVGPKQCVIVDTELKIPFVLPEADYKNWGEIRSATRWVSFYTNNSTGEHFCAVHESRQSADKAIHVFTGGTRFACVEVTAKEGDGL